MRFHLANREHVMAKQSNIPLVLYRKVNEECTLNLAHQAATVSVKRFIFISFVGINGVETFAKPFS